MQDKRLDVRPMRLTFRLSREQSAVDPWIFALHWISATNMQEFGIIGFVYICGLALEGVLRKLVLPQGKEGRSAVDIPASAKPSPEKPALSMNAGGGPSQ
jgi:hypothetical protein